VQIKINRCHQKHKKSCTCLKQKSKLWYKNGRTQRNRAMLCLRVWRIKLLVQCLLMHVPVCSCPSAKLNACGVNNMFCRKSSLFFFFFFFFFFFLFFFFFFFFFFVCVYNYLMFCVLHNSIIQFFSVSSVI